ncbi:MAG: NAD(P)H-binding protein [Actinomycetota bacterium]|nr:NAD(P)H-binding protein [Actinomycetota bacterium]
MDIVVAGATGFVGSHLVTALDAAGHDVRAMTRHPDGYDGAGRPVAGDVEDAASLDEALAGADVAYYLVHALDDDDFERKDADAARAFGTAAAAAGVQRIVYLGGLGAEDPAELSPHLRSRRQVETLLGDSGVPVTVLRAAIVVGHGGVSWEITRQLVEKLPVMIAPRWVDTRTQPIALDDAVRYLAAMADHPDAGGRVFEIGGPEAMTYGDMLRRAAKLRSGRQLPVAVVPLLTPRLSAMWIALVTDVDTTTARNLIESMVTEVVVTDRSIETVVPGAPLDYDEAVRRAIAQRNDAAAEAATVAARGAGDQG